MRTEILIEDIDLVAEAGDANDALDLVRQLIRSGNVKLAIEIRRAVTGESLDRDALRKIGATVARQHAESAALYTPQVIDGLYAMEAALLASLRKAAETPAAERRAQSVDTWTSRQRYEERVAAYNGEVERVNRARGLAANRRQSAAVRAKTCTECFEVPAANGTCSC